MKQIHSNLVLCSLTPEQHARTCNYWYTVTTNYSTAHTAFRTEEGLHRWLFERGLTLPGPLPARGEHGVLKIQGSYATNVLWDLKELEDLRDLDDTAVQTKVMSNGEYTLGVLTKGDDGIVVVNSMNVNVHERVVYDYWSSQAEMDTFPQQETESRSTMTERG